MARLERADSARHRAFSAGSGKGLADAAAHYDSRREPIPSILLLGAFVSGGSLSLVAGAPMWVALAYGGLGVSVLLLRGRLRGGAGARRPRADERAATAAPQQAVARRPPPDPPAARPETASGEQAPNDDVLALARSPALRLNGRAVIGYMVVNRPVPPENETAGEAIRALCDARRLQLLTIAHDVEPARGECQARPALRWALDQLTAGRAQTLVVARLGHLAETVASLSELLRWFEEHGRTLIAIDFRIDTSTEAGRLAARALVRVGGWEHDRISARTRRGLEAARSRGATSGRPAVADVPDLMDRIRGMRADGMTLQAIADVLNAEGVPTLRGGARWRPSSVQSATGYRRPSASAKHHGLPPPPASG
jgi:DNA invertase Pin-like site-specific DNA recombinase